MSITNDWITNKISQAKTGKELLTMPVVIRMENLLRDTLTCRSLTKKELAANAKQLIMDMIPPSPETGEKE